MGSAYWVDNIAYVIGTAINNTNPPYGTQNLPGSGRTAVIEMWGYHYGPTLADRRYGLEHSNPVGGLGSITSEQYIYILERTRNVWTFIPAGLPHDLIDFNQSIGGFENSSILNDVIGGFSQADIFHQLDATILSPSDIKIPLVGIAPSGVTSEQINLLFGNYSY